MVMVVVVVVVVMPATCQALVKDSSVRQSHSSASHCHLSSADRGLFSRRRRLTDRQTETDTTTNTQRQTCRQTDIHREIGIWHELCAHLSLDYSSWLGSVALSWLDRLPIRLPVRLCVSVGLSKFLFDPYSSLSVLPGDYGNNCERLPRRFGGTVYLGTLSAGLLGCSPTCICVFVSHFLSTVSKLHRLSLR